MLTIGMQGGKNNLSLANFEQSNLLHNDFWLLQGQQLNGRFIQATRVQVNQHGAIINSLVLY